MFLSSGCPTQTSSASSLGWRSVTWPQTHSRAITPATGTTTSLRGCGGWAPLLVAAAIMQAREKPYMNNVWARSLFTLTNINVNTFFLMWSSHVHVQPAVCGASGGCGWWSSGRGGRMHISGGADAKEWQKAEEARPRAWDHRLCNLWGVSA